MAKSSKSGGGAGKRKGKKSGPESAAMKVQAPKLENPFESIWSRRKFDVLGTKRKGEQHRVGLARSRAIDKRKNTLLKEYEQSGKSSVFIDKRIGEKNDALGEFDKAIIRSQRERQLKIGKKSKFILPDGEEDDDFDGQGFGGLDERDDFEEEMMPDDDDDDEANGNLKDSFRRQNVIERDRSEGEENKHKSKKEVMEEIILKSKMFKAQKAKDKEENEVLMEELDKSFTSLVQSRTLLSVTEPGKMNALKSLVNKSIPNVELKKDDFPATQSIGNLNREKADLYDKMVREMAMEMRARPSDRTKTPEEIAQEERERLESLEEQRQKRMLATDDLSDEEHANAEQPSSQRPRAVSGDDLGDSFTLYEEPKPKKGWVDEILERRDDDASESEEGDSSENDEDEENDSDEEGSDDDDDGAHEKGLSIKDWEQSDDENHDSSDDEGGEEDDEDDDVDEKETDPRDSLEGKKTCKTSEISTESLDAKKKKADDKQKATRSDLPYLIEAPKSMEEFCALLDNCSNSEIILIINRIRASNAIKLAADNRKKMQVFYGVLLQYFAVLANKKPLNIELLNLLVKPLMDMSTEIPFFAAICARERISRTRTQFCALIKNPDNSCWPSSKTLFLLRLWSLIFPCSDFHHAVMTPATLLMSEYLMRCPIVSGRDVAVGSFLCSILLSVAKQSQKFCPEAIVFIRTMLMAAKTGKTTKDQDTQYSYRMELKALNPMLRLHGQVNKIDPLNFFAIMDMPDDDSHLDSDNFRASVLSTVIEALRGYVNVYEALSAFPEIFLRISVLLLEVAEQENMVGPLHDKLKDVAQLIETKLSERKPLQMLRQKPAPIKTLAPKFEDDFVKGKDYDPDRERVERKKLKKLVRQEAKGAIRELRKDNYFLQEVKAREKALKEEERLEKSNKVRAFLEEQQHAFNSGQLGKGRKRRR